MTVLAGNRSTVTSFKLDYVKPATEGVVEFSTADLDEGAMVWKNALIGYTVGDLPQFKEVVNFVHKLWSEYQIPRIHILKQGVFLFDFDSEEGKNQILARHWSFNLTNLVLMEWTPDFHVDDDSPHLVPVWVKFPNLPFRFWSKRNLSKIASAIGRPVSIDAFTAQRELLKYARVLVELEIGAPLKSAIQFKFPDGSMYDQSVFYEWIPIHCPTCNLCGHKGEDCPKSKLEGRETGVQSSVNTNSAPVALSNAVQVNVSNVLLASQEAVSQSEVSANDVLEQLLPVPFDFLATARAALNGSRYDVCQYDTKTNDLLAPDGQDFFTPFGVVYDSFDSMGLHDNLLRGIYGYGFEKPSPIQQRGIVPFCQGLDMILEALPGTGKTTTFFSGILQRLDYNLLQCQALVLAPTREIVRGNGRLMQALGEYLGVKVHACVGGSSVGEDQRILASGVHVIVGTPGRVLNLLQRQSLRPDYIKMFVLDDEDEILSQSFSDEVYDIFLLLPAKLQVGVFSETLGHEALTITRTIMDKPVRISMKVDELTLEGIKQFYVNVEQEESKLETLFDIFETFSITQAVIFVNTRLKVNWLTGKMRRRDHTVSATHGDMDKNTRDLIMVRFCSGSSRVLITTDCLARGIDVERVSHVINYDLPTQPENYAHRIGLSGRFGRKLVAITFVTSNEERMLLDIQKFNNVIIEELPDDVASLL